MPCTCLPGVKTRPPRSWVRRGVGIGPYLFEHFSLGRANNVIVVNCFMVDLKPWLSAHGLTVRQFALDLDVPLKTAQDWVYRGVVPSTDNQGKVAEFIRTHCAHYWVIAVPNGPISEGVCQHCGRVREFHNSAEYTFSITRPRNATAKAVEGKSAA